MYIFIISLGARKKVNQIDLNISLYNAVKIRKQRIMQYGEGYEIKVVL